MSSMMAAREGPLNKQSTRLHATPASRELRRIGSFQVIPPCRFPTFFSPPSFRLCLTTALILIPQAGRAARLESQPWHQSV